MEETINTIGRRGSRVHILKRADGTFTYRKQSSAKDGWGPIGLDAGVYDSAETAESEARARVWWPADS